MPEALPKLRTNLDFMPSPDPEHPGLLIRDSYRYSDAMLIVPPLVVECLQLFDGGHTEADIRELLYRRTGELNTGAIVQNIVETMSRAGFLEDGHYQLLRSARHAEFSAAALRHAAHAGGAYPAEMDALRSLFTSRLGPRNGAARSNQLMGIAAPHVSPDGGWDCYRAAYACLTPEYADRTFLVLGTSHYGEPNRFGITRKNFVTPYGEARTAVDLVDLLTAAAPEAVLLEDYCHAVEHSIEFQVIFLQHIYGPDVRILPVLCGSYARSIYFGGQPEDDENVARFVGALGDLAARNSDRLFWVLGIDMAHMGRRYGDPFIAREGEGQMVDVESRDRKRIGSVAARDTGAFWAQVQENRDDLKWCGSAPLYTFLKAAPHSRGELLHYHQWNIDEQSVVSFAGMAFHR